ncbi:MAG TPA: hypothetical protein VFM18_12590, partial [Methanosarcina sp.]|nr:hypothetical protein [Methanosarcina sp.]
KKREHRINVDLFQTLHRLYFEREKNCRRLIRDRFKLKGEFVYENENENHVYVPCPAGGLRIGLHGSKKGNCPG